MLHIKCPHCGMRSQNEFSYGGDGTVKRPELNQEVSDQEWNDFVYLEKVQEENIGSYGNIYQDVDNGLKLKETQLLMKFFKLQKANEEI